MAGDVSANNIRIGANIKGLLDGLKKGSAAVRSMTFDMNNKLADSYRRANKEQSVFRGGLLKLGDDIQGVASKMAMIGTLPTLLAAGKAYQDYAELQKLEKGLTRYGETIQNVREIAKLPNIGVFDAAKSLISLKAMKMSSDLATRSIKAFANAITDAGGSAIDLEPALINLRQFKATRHVNQVDVRQLAMRIPQTYDALQAAFGTQDTEKLNQEMTKLGSDVWIDKFIKELEKIPKAGGGAATAMEQLKDSVLFFSASVGKGIDETFKVSEKLQTIGGILDNLSTSFGNLAPEAKKSIFAIGAIAVVMPAVMGAVGGLVKLLPLLATGFGLISAPVAATVAVVSVAAAAIITNWDSVKSFLVESTWWNTIVGAAKAGLGVISELFKVVINFIQADWSNMGKALVNIMKNTSNLVVTAIGGLLKAVVGIFATGALGLFRIFDKRVDNSAFFKGINSAVGSVDGLVNKFKFDVPDSFNVAKSAIGSVSKVLGKVTGDTGKLTESNKGLSGSYDELKDAAKPYQDLLKRESEELEKQKKLREDIKNITDNIKPLDSSVTVGGYYGKGAESFGVSLAGKKGITALSGRASEIGSLPDQMRNRLTEQSIQSDATQKLFAAFEGKMDYGKIQKYFAEIPRIAGESLYEYQEKLEKFGSISAQLSSQMSGAFREMAANVAIGFGEMLGDLMSGVDGLDTFANKVVGALSGLLKEMGKAMIAAGTAGLAMKLLMKNPALTLAAGIGLVAVGQALNNNVGKSLDKTSMTAFADGGFAHKDMIARVGDNRNARFDPEMIAPYSKVDQSIKKSISESGGGGNVFIPEMRLQGQDIYVAFKRAEQSNKALF